MEKLLQVANIILFIHKMEFEVINSKLNVKQA